MAEINEPDLLRVHQTVNQVMDALLPLDPASREKVYRVIGTYFGFADLHPTEGASTDDREPREPHFRTQEPLTPKEFLFEKQTTTNVQRVACLAYYLAQYRDMPHFKTIDISKLNTEAAQAKFTNPSSVIRDATQSGYLTAATKGMKQLTAAGEKFVESLPDQTAAREAMSRARPRRGRKKARSKAQGSTNSGE